MNKFAAVLAAAILLPSLAMADSRPSVGWAANFPGTPTCDSTFVQGYGAVSFGSTGTALNLYINGTVVPTAINGTQWTVDNPQQGLPNSNGFNLAAGSNAIDLQLTDASGTILDEYTKTYTVPACVAAQSAQNSTQTGSGASQTGNTTQVSPPVNTSPTEQNTPSNVSSSAPFVVNPTVTVVTQDDPVLVQELMQLIQVLTEYLAALEAQRAGQ